MIHSIPGTKMHTKPYEMGDYYYYYYYLHFTDEKTKV